LIGLIFKKNLAQLVANGSVFIKREETYQSSPQKKGVSDRLNEKLLLISLLDLKKDNVS